MQTPLEVGVTETSMQLAWAEHVPIGAALVHVISPSREATKVVFMFKVVEKLSSLANCELLERAPGHGEAWFVTAWAWGPFLTLGRHRD